MPFDILAAIFPRFHALSTLFTLLRQVRGKNLGHLWYSYSSSNLVVPSFFQSFFPSFLCYFSPPPVCQVIFHPSSSCHALPPFHHRSHRCCPHRIALRERFSLYSFYFFSPFFFFFFWLHLYILPRRPFFTSRFLLAIILSLLFLFFWFSFHTRDITLHPFYISVYLDSPLDLLAFYFNRPSSLLF